MFGGDLQVAADVVLDQFGHVFRRLLGQVHADAGGDVDLVDARDLAAFLHQVDERAVVGSQQLADLGMDAREPLALGLDLGTSALHLVHVGGGTADVGDHA